MTHHAHAHRTRTSTRRGLPQPLVVLAGLALIGVVLLLPDLGQPASRPDVDPVTATRGRIIEVARRDPSDPDAPPIAIAEVELLEGPRAGERVSAFLEGPGGSQSLAGYGAGDEVVVTITAGTDGAEPYIAVSDRWRLPMLEVLGLLFAAAVIAVGGWRGARALIALGLTIAVILKILLPLVIAGVPPVPLAVLAASAVTVATILLTEGASRASAAAILGTAGALATTGLISAAVTAFSGFTYTAGSDLAFLTTAGGQGLDLRGLMLAAFMLGAVGVLDDVTVTQAALVDELGATGLRGRVLFASALGVGRSHIAATVNTLFLAYVGASLPLLVVLVVSRQPGALVVNSEAIAVEIVRTLTGSLGIVAAVPLTTSIAVALLPAGDGEPAVRRGVPPGVVVVGLAVAILLLATAALPLTGGPRAALPTQPPLAIPSAGAPSDGAPAPGAGDPGEPRIAAVGEPLTLTQDGVAVGTATVVTLSRQPGSAADEERIAVVVRYEADAPWDLRLARWAVLAIDGSESVLEPVDVASPATLDPGGGAEVVLATTVPAGLTDAFVVYEDGPDALPQLAIPLD